MIMQPELTSPHLLYSQKEDDYFSNPRSELVELINGTDLKILEIGCGRGATGKKLRESRKAKSLTGIELTADNASIARSIYDEVYVGDVERMTFDWCVKDFDCFVLGDVLEHLADPWGLLKRLRPFLSDDGIVVASVPNVKYWPVIANLILRDDWRYVESGVLDITHLRFFTRTSAVCLFSENGYSLDTIRPCFNGRRYSIPSKITFGVFAGFLAQQWLMRLSAAA